MRLRVAVLAAALAATAAIPAHAAERPGHYFIEFRARPGHLMGHTIIVYGRMNARGAPANVHYAGLYPSDGQTGLIFGAVLPVDASVRRVSGDISERPSAVYRRSLTAAQYRRLQIAVNRERRREDYWQLLLFNCNDFAARIGGAIGLRTPPTLLLPPAFVRALRSMNES